MFEFKLPDIGEGVSEGEIVAWHVREGDRVAEDDPMVEVMTDKATVTIGAPRAGTIVGIRFSAGEVAQVGHVIVSIAPSSDSAARAPAAASATAEPDSAPPKKPPVASAVGDIRDGLPGVAAFAASTAEPGAARGAKPLATPAVRKLARDLGVDLSQVPPSGPGLRITKADVESFSARAASAVASSRSAAETSAAPSSSTPSSSAPSVSAPSVSALSGATPSFGTEERREPFVGIRRKIAERMRLAKDTAAHFTFVEECAMDRLIDIRSRLRQDAAAHGVELSYLPFVVKAVVWALRDYPVLSSTLDVERGELVYRAGCHIGIAAATDAGLVVPVIRDADQRSLLDIAREISRLSAAARSGALSRDELTGSVFTITSLGKQGGLLATPIINVPEVGILGLHQIKEKPVVRDGSICVGQVMLVSLSFDHRVVDGHVGAAFAYEVIGYLQNPERFFLNAV